MAAACDVGRADWTIGADDRVFTFHRRSSWLELAELQTSGQPTGIIRRTSCFSGDTIADLPTMSLLAQVFALSVALCVWDTEKSTTDANNAAVIPALFVGAIAAG